MVVSAPMLPVHRVYVRLDRKAGVWRPCREDDSRGSMVISVDSLGRAVVPAFGTLFGADGSGPPIRGYRLAVASESMAHEEFKKWIENHPRLEIVK